MHLELWLQSPAYVLLMANNKLTEYELVLTSGVYYCFLSLTLVHSIRHVNLEKIR